MERRNQITLYLPENMFSPKDIAALIRKEFQLEFHQSYAIGGILLYVASSVFVVMVAFRTIEFDATLWNLVFWIVFIFASINAVLKSFVSESSDRYLYYYQLTHPINILFSKVIYNTLLLFVIGLLLMFSLIIISASPIVHWDIFLLAILMGSLSLSLCFTFISSIAIKADNSATLMAILSFPLIIPILISLIEMTTTALGLSFDQNISRQIAILGSIQLLLCGGGIFLFPYLWRS